MTPLQETSHYIYRLLDGNIHEFRFLTASIQTVDVWIEQVEAITVSTPSDQTVRYLYDSTESGMLPVGYAAKRAREMIERHPDRPRSRSAFVNPAGAGVIVSALGAFIRLIASEKHDAYRFFRPDQRDAAIAWLLEG